MNVEQQERVGKYETFLEKSGVDDIAGFSANEFSTALNAAHSDGYSSVQGVQAVIGDDGYPIDLSFEFKNELMTVNVSAYDKKFMAFSAANIIYLTENEDTGSVSRSSVRAGSEGVCNVRIDDERCR